MMNKLKILVAFLCLAVGQQAFAATVGKALVVLGQAEKIMANGAVSLSVGDEIAENDIVRTLPGAVVQIGLKDGGFIAVRPNSSVSVEQFILDKENPQREKQITKVFAGSIQAVTGRIGKRLPSNVTYATPVATMGIRGTVIDLGVAPDGQSIARVLVGSAVFSTPQGSIPMTKGSSVSVNRGQAPRKDAAAGKSLASESAAVKAQVVAVVGESPMDVVVETEKQVETAKTLKKEIQAKLDDVAVADDVKEVLKSELASVDTALASVEQALDTVKTQLAVEAVSVAVATATVDAVKDAFTAIKSTESALVEKAIIQSNYTESYSDPETSNDALSDDESSTESESAAENDTAVKEDATDEAEAETTVEATETQTDESVAESESDLSSDTATESSATQETSSNLSVTSTSTSVTNIAKPTAIRTSRGGSSSNTSTTEQSKEEVVEEEVVEEEVVEEEVVEEEVVEEEVVEEEVVEEEVPLEDSTQEDVPASDQSTEEESDPTDTTSEEPVIVEGRTEEETASSGDTTEDEVLAPEEDPFMYQEDPFMDEEEPTMVATTSPSARLSLRTVEDDSASPSR